MNRIDAGSESLGWTAVAAADGPRPGLPRGCENDTTLGTLPAPAFFLPVTGVAALTALLGMASGIRQ